MKKLLSEIYIKPDLEEKINKVILQYPSLNLTMIVNEALEEWLRGPQSINLQRNSFITDAPECFGPKLKQRA